MRLTQRKNRPMYLGPYAVEKIARRETREQAQRRFGRLDPFAVANFNEI